MKLFFKQHVFEVEKVNDLIEVLAETEDSYLEELRMLLIKWFSDESDFVVQSSGSTGVPKSMLLSKEEMRASAALTITTFGLNSFDKLLLCLPLSSIAGIMMLIRSIELESDLVVSRPSANPFLAIAENVKVDFAAITPYQAKNSMLNLKGVSKIIIGGAPISSHLEQSLLAQTNDTKNQVYETYGMTETITHIAIRALSNPKTDLFRTLKGVSLSTDERSCLCIRAEHLNNRLIQTNDIVQLKSKNTFEFIGRYDEMINSGGIKINPQKIEDTLSNLIAERYFISAEENEDFGHIPILVVESKKEKSYYEGILNSVHFDLYHKPKRIYIIDEFVSSHSNKVDKIQSLKKISS